MEMSRTPSPQRPHQATWKCRHRQHHLHFPQLPVQWALHPPADLWQQMRFVACQPWLWVKPMKQHRPSTTPRAWSDKILCLSMGLLSAMRPLMVGFARHISTSCRAERGGQGILWFNIMVLCGHDDQEHTWPSSALIIKKQWCNAILYNHKSWEIRSFPR